MSSDHGSGFTPADDTAAGDTTARDAAAGDTAARLAATRDTTARDTAAGDGVTGDGTVREEPDQATVEAVGKLTEALETVEVARGHLYAFHQLTGSADFALEEAIELLDRAGHTKLAADLSRELLGRNVLPGRWTFQVIEDYEDTYYQVFRDFERRARQLVHGQRHRYEAGLKSRRRTPGEPGHEAHPDDVTPASSQQESAR